MVKKLLLVFIILIAFFLRSWQLGINPPSLTWDEAAWGYNAYSLGVDGKDEFGRFLPHDYLESFGDFKPPVYAYLDVLPVKIFGLNEFATRFPSAFFGTLTVLLTFFLTRSIFKSTNVRVNSELVALFSSFFLAISPWHINLSRAAFEANVSTFFLVLGAYCFIAFTQGKKWYLVISAISFVISIYTFNTARVVAPLLVIALGVGYKKYLLGQKKQVVIAGIVGLLLLLPTLKFLLSPQANLRFREVNIFSDISVIERINQEVANDNTTSWSKIIHNRRVTFGVEFIKHYFDNLNPSFLFIKGDGNPKFSTQSVGQLYVWDLAFLVIGFFTLLKQRIGSWWVLPIWIVLGIIPAATARETPHALRIETIIPTIQIIVAYGFTYTISQIRNNYPKILISFLVVAFLFLAFNFLYYFHDYYAHYPYDYSGEWQYGYKQSISYVQTVAKNYDHIYVTTDLGRPYIYYLFYTHTNPFDFRASANISRDAFGFVSVNSFGKYTFLKDVNNVKNKQRALFINTGSVPSNAKKLEEFKLLNGNIILVAYTF